MLYFVSNHYRQISDDDFQSIERYVVLIYARSSILESVNDCRKALITKKGRNIESLPPTRDALIRHSMKALLQGWYVIMAIVIKVLFQHKSSFLSKTTTRCSNENISSKFISSQQMETQFLMGYI